MLIHENRGLTAHQQDVVRRFAKEGYTALAVDLLSRQGHRLLQIGVVLLLFSSFEGFAIPFLGAPRLGLSAYYYYSARWGASHYRAPAPQSPLP